MRFYLFILPLFFTVLISGCSKEDIGPCGPTNGEIFDFQIGDVFQFYSTSSSVGWDSYGFLSYQIVEKENKRLFRNGTFRNMVVYRMQGFSFSYPHDYDITCGKDTVCALIDTLDYTEEYYSIEGNDFAKLCDGELIDLGNGQYQYLTVVDSIRQIGGAYYKYDNDKLVKQDFLDGTRHRACAKSLGLVYESYGGFEHGGVSGLTGFKRDNIIIGKVLSFEELMNFNHEIEDVDYPFQFFNFDF